MPKTKISEFSATPGNNTDIDGINIAEGCAPSGINDAIRELMAQLKDFQAGTAGDSFNGPVGTSTAAAGAFTTLSSTGNTTLGDASGDAVTINGATTFVNVSPTITPGTANGVAYLNGSKVLTTGSALVFDGTNLGVGVLNTNALLTVAGDKTQIRVERGSAIGFVYNTGTASTDPLRIQSNAGPIDIYTASGQPITFSAGATEQARLTSTGLGIGTSSPNYSLTSYKGGAVANYLQVASGATGAGSLNGLLLGVDASGNGVINAQGGVVNLYTYVAGVLRTTIDSSGNLGIGTSSPAQKLDVVGTIQSQNNAAVNDATVGAYNFYNSNASAAANPIRASIVAGRENSAWGAYLDFYTSTGTSAQTAKMRLDTAGNLGLGVTPSAWISGALSLDVRSTSSFADVGGSTTIANNSYRNSGGGWVYKTTNYASKLETDTGVFRWFTAPSGTAGNAISFTQAMTLDSDGNLALGRSSVTTLGTNIRTIDLDGIQGSGFRFRANGTSYAYIFGGSAQTDLATLTSTPLIFSTNATERARITSNGNLVVGQTGGDYRILSVVPSGADRDMFLAGVSGVTNGLQVNYINSGAALSVKFNDITTTASAANAFLDSANANRIYRSTSSIRYKKDIEDIDHEFADAALNLRPVWYRSKTDSDNKDWSWYGLIAEEVAEVEPRLVHWTYPEEAFDVETVDGVIKKTVKDGAERIPDGVQYERLSVLLLDIVKRQNARIESLEAKVAALESNP